MIGLDSFPNSWNMYSITYMGLILMKEQLKTLSVAATCLVILLDLFEIYGFHDEENVMSQSVMRNKEIYMFVI